jgi:hypothetical protein
MPSESDYVGVLRQNKLDISELNMTDVMNVLVSNKEALDVSNREEKSVTKVRAGLIEDKATDMQMVIERYLQSVKDVFFLSCHANTLPNLSSSLMNWHARLLHLISERTRRIPFLFSTSSIFEGCIWDISQRVLA